MESVGKFVIKFFPNKVIVIRTKSVAVICGLRRDWVTTWIATPGVWDPVE